MRTKKLCGSLLVAMLALVICFSIVAVPTQNMTAEALMAGHARTGCTVEMNQHINDFTAGGALVWLLTLGRAGFVPVEGVKDIRDANGNVIEKWQLYRSVGVTRQEFAVASETVTPALLARVPVYSFELRAGSADGSSKVRGSYFNAGGGVNFTASVPIVGIKTWELEITAQYQKEMKHTTTTSQSRSVSYTVSNVTTPGTWVMYHVIEGYTYTLLRFTHQPVYAVRDVYDNKGKWIGTETYVDHHAWQHRATETIQTNVSEHFRIARIA